MQNTRPELFLTPARLNYRDRSVVRVHTDRIACICPQSGRVVGWIDLTGATAVHLSARVRSRVQRDRIRCVERSTLRDGEAVAETVRDRTDAALKPSRRRASWAEADWSTSVLRGF